MAEYKAPLRDMQFLLKDVFEADKLWARLPGVADVVGVGVAEGNGLMLVCTDTQPYLYFDI